MRSTESDEPGLEELVTLYCEAWGEPDAARRRALLDQVWAEDATYTDPTVHARGRDELVHHIAEILKKYPGSRIARTSVVDAHHGMFRFAWHMVLADGRELPAGIDFGEVSRDGRLQRIVGFFGQLQAR